MRMGDIRNGGIRHIGEVFRDRNIIIHGGDAFTQEGFTQVPNRVFDDEKLTPGEKLAYAALLRYAWNNDYCFPGQKRLGKDCGVRRETANSYLGGLQRKGWLKIKKRGQGKTNIYELFIVPQSKRKKATKKQRS